MSAEGSETQQKEMGVKDVAQEGVAETSNWASRGTERGVGIQGDVVVESSENRGRVRYKLAEMSMWYLMRPWSSRERSSQD